MKNNSSGFVFLEILIAITLFSIAFTSLLGIGIMSLNNSTSVQEKVRADFLIKEEFEALRNFRDGTDWATNGLGIVDTGVNYPYYMANNANSWVLTPGSETIDIFTRQIIFDKVSRDASQKIETAYNPTNDDPDTRKVTIKVLWNDKTISTISYLTNWQQ